jgi:hypothetical protein
VDLINAGRYEDVPRLFADDGVFRNPHGDRYEGTEAIREFVVEHLTRQKPKMRLARCVESDGECWGEMEAEHPETGEMTLISANHFTVDDQNRIKQLIVFLLPHKGWT